MVRALQRANDQYPFVIAGRYSSRKSAGTKKRLFYGRAKHRMRRTRAAASDALVRTMEAYDSAFWGAHKESSTMWVVNGPALDISRISIFDHHAIGLRREGACAAEAVSPTP